MLASDGRHTLKLAKTSARQSPMVAVRRINVGAGALQVNVIALYDGNEQDRLCCKMMMDAGFANADVCCEVGTTEPVNTTCSCLKFGSVYKRGLGVNSHSGTLFYCLKCCECVFCCLQGSFNIAAKLWCYLTPCKM